MTSLRGTMLARSVGLLAGVAVAIGLLILSRPASGGEAIGAEVSAVATPTGELGTAPAGPRPFLKGRYLNPGERVSGSFRVTNQTGSRLALRLRATPSAPDLNQLLWLELRSGDQVLASGRLGTMRSPGRARLDLRPGERATVKARAWIPPGSRSGWEARLVEIEIGFAIDKVRHR